MIFWRLTYVCSIIYICQGKETYKSVKQFMESEIERLKKNDIRCSLTKLTKRTIEHHRLQQVTENLEACYIRYLSENEKDGFIWSTLGDVYNAHGKKFTAQTNFCFKQAQKISGKHTPFIKDWFFLGPFVIGKTEFDGDPVEAFGGIRNASRYRYTKTEYYSELMQGAVLKWTPISQKGLKEGLRLAPVVPWNDLVSSLGSLGITEWQGWLVGEFAVNSEDNFVFQCLGVSTFYIDDTFVNGDVYQREEYWSTVNLNRGTHTMYIPLRTKISTTIRCSIKIAQKTFQVHNPPFLPDLYAGRLFGSYVHIPVSNLHSSKWIKNIKVSLTEQSEGEPITLKTAKNNFSVAPGQVRPIIVFMSSTKQITSTCEKSGVDIKLTVSTSEGSETLGITLRCRNLHNSVVFTFLDHDGSVQHAAAIKPIRSCDMKPCPVMLTLHGTTVPPQNQADSYKYMADGEYVFGVDNMWLLAPTRHGAHNWEGPGLLTALSALKALKELIDKAEWLDYTIDVDHLVVAGHSMGGHGAWHLATHYPDRVMSLVSLAGWIKKEEYGDSNLFFKHDVATSYTDPAVKAVMEACISENDADKHISNLKGIPVFARIGADDRTVHPFYMRRMVRLLEENKINVVYSEPAGKEHWWWDTSKTNDGGVVNDDSIRKFMAKYSQPMVSSDDSTCNKDGDCAAEADVRYSRHGSEEFTLITVNPALGEGMRGVRILQQIVPFRVSHIKVTISQEKITLITENVAKFEIRESPNRKIFWKHQDVVKIDNTLISKEDILQSQQNEFSHFQYVHGEGWTLSLKDFYLRGERGPENLGPARRIAEKEFLIIVGSSGSKEMKTDLLSSAVYIANLFFLTSDTIVNIVMDKDISSSQLENKNIICLGSPNENLWTEEYLARIPLKYDSRNIELNSCTYSSDSKTGVVTLAPNGNRNIAMLIFGNSKDGLLDAVSLSKPTIPPMTRSPFSNLLPDFVITGTEYRLKGPGGFRCAGFWDNKWQMRQELASCVCLS